MEKSNDIINTFIEHRIAIQQYLARRVGCGHTAADIFQKIAEKLLARNPTESVQNSVAYLYQTARNEVVDHFRAEQARNRYESEVAAAYDDSDPCHAERVAIAENELQQLNKALAELPQLSRHIFLMYRLHGIKQKAIAEQLNLNLSTVEKRLAQAMKHCRLRMRVQPTYGKIGSQTSYNHDYEK